MKFKYFLVLLTVFSAFFQVSLFAQNYQIVKSGETKAEVISKMGKPVKKDVHFKNGLRREIWVYDCRVLTRCSSSCERFHYTPCKYLFFEDGELKFWRLLE